MDNIAFYSFLFIVAVILIAIAVYFIKNTQSYPLVEFERVAVFKKSGEFIGIRGPGLVRIWPSFLFIWSGEQIRGTHGQIVDGPDTPDCKFDLREISTALPEEHCITGDNAVVHIPPAIIYQIIDPEKLVLNIANHEAALITAVNATLRAVVGGMSLTDVVTGRESIAKQMTARLTEQADRWGIAVISVEIQDIKPDPEVERAMNERRAAEERAERDRQDLVVAAEARRQGAVADNEATIALAEAEKQATIIRVEAEKQTTITRAEAEKQAAITRAEGAKATEILRTESLTSLYKMLLELGATGADVALRYEQIQALQNIGGSPNSKLVILPANVAANMDSINGLSDISSIETIISS